MSKVFLVSPSMQKNVRVHSKNNSIGLGLAYLHSVIEQAGHLIRTKNYNNVDINTAEEKIVAELESFNPELFLIQIFTMNRVASYRIIQLAKKVRPHIKIIVGGVHASIYYEQLLKNFEVDYVVIGEGEITVVELLNAITCGTSANGIRGIAYRGNGEIMKNPDRDLIENLDTIPFPSHELFIEPDRVMACILTSRGCPFKCSFCCLHTISRRKFRKRSVKNVVDEVEYILNNFRNINTIQIADDTFTLDQQRAIDFCKEVIKRKLKVKFWCSARIKPASHELFEFMEKAGFTSIGFGLETGSEKLLETIHKNITRADVIRTFEILKNRRINVTTYLMLGFPGETRETVAETIDLIKKLQKIKYFEFTGLALLWVFPNTEIYELMLNSGRMDDSYWLTEKDVPYFTLEHSEEALDLMVTEITLSCTPVRQWIKRFINGMWHPISATKLVLSRVPKLKKFFDLYG